ncbi:MAG: outer membrane protein [Gammaproteobacteria bacterium]|jgi:outer membrane protein
MNMFFSNRLFIINCALTALCAASLQVGATNLEDVYNIAETSDPQFKQVAAATRAILERRPQALAGFMPTANFSAGTTGNDQNLNSAGIGTTGKTTFNSHNYSLDVSQPLFRLDRFIALKQADSIIKQADAELSSAQQDLMIRVSEAYFDVLAAQDSYEFAQAEKKSLSKQLDQAKQRFEVGLTAITDVQEAQAGFDLAVSQEIVAENEIDNTSEGLRAITGEYTANLHGVSDDMPLVNPQPEIIDTWTDTALEQNLDVLSAHFAVDTAREEIRRQKAGHLPTVDLVARHGFDKSGGRFGSFSSRASSIGVQLNVPLFQGGFVNSKTREAQQRLDEQFQRLEQARRQAQRLTRQAYLGVISGISQVKALKQAVVSSETALLSTQAGFEVGTRTAVDVVASERTTFQARRNYSRSRYDYILNTLRLKRAAGVLSTSDLSQLSQWLK